VSIGSLVRRTSRFASNNAPTILTAVAVTGTLTTALLTGKAAFKADQVIRDEQTRLDREDQSHPLSLKEKAQLTWPLFIPAAGTGLLTIGCIVTANRISVGRAAMLASAYTVAQEGFKEYADKVVEHIGVDQEKEIRNKIAQDRVDKNPPPTVIVTGSTCQVHDQYTERYFVSSYNDLVQAEIDTNYKVLNEGSATLADFWRFLGVTHSTMSEEIGWTHEKKLELNIGAAISENNVPVLTLDFRTVPVRI
jgi:hypothetical protein